MFDDALVESAGKLKTRSKYWMFATLAFNLAIVAALVLVPLLHPAALPRTALTAMLTAPPPPPPAARPTPPQVVRQTKAVAALNAMVAPAKVPHRIEMTKEPPPLPASDGVLNASALGDRGTSTGVFTALGLGTAPISVTREPERPKQTGPLRVSSGVAAGALVAQTTPIYPAIAKAARVSGTVLLHAVISKTGTIESLQVISGSEMLRSSALDAVRQWRYRPYLLNGQPTAVETTITVNFSFSS